MALDALDKQLLLGLVDGRFHSGTALAEVMGISRTAVWKHIQALEALGLELSAVPGRGYRLLSPVELLEEDRIRTALSHEAAALQNGFDLHDCLDSTNSHLMRKLAEGAATGLVCLTEYQRAGRGRIGRTWVSPFGANIYLSVLWRFEDPAQAAGLSLAVGAVVLRALKSIGIQGLGLKWPNDILWNEAKLGGILIEVAGEAHGRCGVVVGVGLNRYLPVTAASVIDQAWSDLSRASGGAAPSRNLMAAHLLNELLPLLRDYPSQGLAPFLPEWRAAHSLAGRRAKVLFGETWIEGRVIDVTDEGLLIFLDDEGRQRRFASGELRLRRKAA
jgi:BirA family biotin operon repressor/biotin-[acetyl-CoA-carboxylase] ligase